ncbi:hypothetical protein Tco_0302093, partial [Tanacetum coccineum]
DDAIEVENPIEHEDETIPASVYKVGESSTTAIPREDGDSLLPGFMRRDIDSLFGRMVSFSRRLCGRETAHALVEKKGKSKDKFYGKLILDLGNEVRSSVGNERLQWKSVTPPDGAWTEYVSEGVTSSYFEHKARENDH